MKVYVLSYVSTFMPGGVRIEGVYFTHEAVKEASLLLKVEINSTEEDPGFFMDIHEETVRE